MSDVRPPRRPPLPTSSPFQVPSFLVHTTQRPTVSTTFLPRQTHLLICSFRSLEYWSIHSFKTSSRRSLDCFSSFESLILRSLPPQSASETASAIHSFSRPLCPIADFAEIALHSLLELPRFAGREKGVWIVSCFVVDARTWEAIRIL
jgi:hypothetical protein